MTKSKPSRPTAEANSAAANASVTTARLSRGKKFAFAFVAILLGTLAVEGMLAIMGIRPAAYASDPYVGYSAETPLFAEERDAEGHAMMATSRTKLAFFNPQRFSKAKPRGTFRVFVLGGSTAYGHPYHDATSFAGWLREYLKATAPGRSWEVVNAGGISYGSYRDARLMEELIRYEPDLFVLYESQNEFLERRIYGQIQRTPGLVRALAGLAAHSRAATVIQRGAEKARRPANATLLPGEPRTLLEQPQGIAAYTRDDLARAQTLEHFRFNLGRMADMSRAVGASIIFINPASNLREVSPFKSEFRSTTPESGRERWRALYEEARRELTNAAPARALKPLDDAAAIDDAPAALHYLRARTMERLGRFADARAAYERARDEDVCPLRAPTAIREIVATVAAERRVPLIDFEALLIPRCDHGILGGQVFLDHVHPTIEGYRLLGLEILKTMEAAGSVKPDWSPSVIDATTQRVLARVDPKEQSLGLMNLGKTLGWAGRREEAYRATARAVELSPDLAEVRYEAGLAAQWVNRTNEAAAHYVRALELQPTNANAHAGYGVILEDQGQLEEAIRHYQLALQFGRPEDRERDQGNLARAGAKRAGRSGAK